MILLLIFFGKPQIIYQFSGQRKGAVRNSWMFHLCLRFHMLFLCQFDVAFLFKNLVELSPCFQVPESRFCRRR